MNIELVDGPGYYLSVRGESKTKRQHLWETSILAGPGDSVVNVGDWLQHVVVCALRDRPINKKQQDESVQSNGLWDQPALEWFDEVD